MSAYLVSVCEVTNKSDDLMSYAQQSAELISKHGGAYIIRGLASEVLEGNHLQGKSLVIAQFPNVDAIKEFWSSPEYLAFKSLREGTGIYDIGVFEGTE
jgi:uncharacterized protein (DUF1330 family)